MTGREARRADPDADALGRVDAGGRVQQPRAVGGAVRAIRRRSMSRRSRPTRDRSCRTTGTSSACGPPIRLSRPGPGPRSTATRRGSLPLSDRARPRRHGHHERRHDGRDPDAQPRDGAAVRDPDGGRGARPRQTLRRRRSRRPAASAAIGRSLRSRRGRRSSSCSADDHASQTRSRATATASPIPTPPSTSPPGPPRPSSTRSSPTASRAAGASRRRARSRTGPRRRPRPASRAATSTASSTGSTTSPTSGSPGST